MAYGFTPKLSFPLKSYQVNSFDFNEWCDYDGVAWGFHLGEDTNRRAGTSVFACGDGKVVYAKLHAGSKQKRNWGNIIIIAHKNPKTHKVFYSLYGHLGKRLAVRGKKVSAGDRIGTVGKAFTPENGFWESHLHFGIYVGPTFRGVLPGYWKPGMKRTKRLYWRKPSVFIDSYQT